jgi:ribonuclease HII
LKFLRASFSESITSIEAGIDEAGRGCLAGPVFAAAVILRPKIHPDLINQLNDSKVLSEKTRNSLRPIIEQNALAYAIASADNNEIDQINILNASFLAMHRAINALTVLPNLLLIDGNRFKPYPNIAHHCIIKGDGLYLSIAAASVLAKTYRDEFMLKAHDQYPNYAWEKNKGYPTPAHKQAIAIYGLTPLHRKSFNSTLQLKLPIE